MNWCADTLTDIAISVARVLLPVVTVGARLLEHPVAQLDDLPRLLGERDEHRRGDRPASGMRPAQQRLDAGDPAVGGVDDRLIFEMQLAAADRAGQPARQAAWCPARCS